MTTPNHIQLQLYDIKRGNLTGKFEYIQHVDRTLKPTNKIVIRFDVCRTLSLMGYRTAKNN